MKRYLTWVVAYLVAPVWIANWMLARQNAAMS